VNSNLNASMDSLQGLVESVLLALDSESVKVLSFILVQLLEVLVPTVQNDCCKWRVVWKMPIHNVVST
jgi:hypothetical protein